MYLLKQNLFFSNIFQKLSKGIKLFRLGYLEMTLTGVRSRCQLEMDGESMLKSMKVVSVSAWILIMDIGGTPGISETLKYSINSMNDNLLCIIFSISDTAKE